MIDPRIPQVLEVIKSTVTSRVLDNTDVYISTDNNAVAIVDETLLYVIPLKDVYDEYPAIGFKYNEDETCINPDFIIKNRIESCYHTYIDLVNNRPLVASDLELKDNEEFDRLLNLKADDGMEFYKMLGNDLHTYMIPVFARFPHNIAKQDTIGIKVYDLLDGYLLIEVDSFKKKINRNVKVFYRALKIN